MIDDDWVNIESSNLYENSRLLQKPNVLKPPEIQEMTVVNKSPPESHRNMITHRNTNTVNSIPEDILVYHDDMMMPKTISSKHERDIYDCVMSLKKYIREAQLFLIKCSHYVDSWDDIV
uniref:Uncharacterized protein n=1 Tax=viral metagenome TaxID=1070528 RepID=A0A6C0CUA7_9ZZZZ